MFAVGSAAPGSNPRKMEDHSVFEAAERASARSASAEAGD
jgi:hypothetical protein